MYVLYRSNPFLCIFQYLQGNIPAQAPTDGVTFCSCISKETKIRMAVIDCLHRTKKMVSSDPVPLLYKNRMQLGYKV